MSNCPKCGAPIQDDLHRAMHEGEKELCQYVETLKRKLEDREDALADIAVGGSIGALQARALEALGTDNE